MKRLLGVSFAVFTVAGIATASAQTVKFEGCAVQPMAHCTMINPVGASYIVNSASPAVPIGKPIRLTGTIVQQMTPCGVLALTKIKWKLSKKKTCV